MDTEPNANLDHLIELESPQDILEAIVNLSRRSSGKVMIHFTSSENESFWIHPLRIQQETDDPNKYPGANNAIKFKNHLEESHLRISDVLPLVLDTTRKMPEDLQIRNAVKAFANDKQLIDNTGGYAGLFNEPTDKF